MGSFIIEKLHPCLARFSAKANPIPEAAPVTNAVSFFLFLSEYIYVFLFLLSIPVILPRNLLSCPYMADNQSGIAADGLHKSAAKIQNLKIHTNS